jgi:hypothetical protein
MTEHSYTVFNALTDIVAAPGKALDQVKSHTAWLWWPLLITIVLGAGMMAYYYSWVDFEFLVEETIRAQPAERRAEVAEGIREFMNPTTSILTTIVAIVLMTFVIYTLQATYLHLANKLTTGAGISWGQWFSFSAWTGFVGVFAVVAALVVILSADSNQLAQTELQPLSMNSLIIHAQPGEPWFTWGSALNLTHLWMLVLMSLGYARWTGAAMAKSTVIAVLPWALIFGIWAAFV